MSYRIEFTSGAKRDFERLAKDVRRRVDVVLMILKDTPRPPNAKRLQGQWHDYYRVRVGDFRIIYAIEDKKLIVCVVRIRNRKNAY